METSMVNDHQPQAAVDSTLPDRAVPPEPLFIDLDLLDDNPYQPRAERDELKSAQLRESIANQGQLQPILVRKAGARWQIIFGHGRVEALRSLRNDAKTEADRIRFSKVRAELRSDVSDEQMLLLGLLENIQREDISPVDCAAALFRLRSLRPDLDTLEAIAREVGMERPRVWRLLRLHAAPQVIKDAVSKGKPFQVPIGARDSDPRMENVKIPDEDRMQEVRKLDLSSALSLARLYAHWRETATDQAASSGGTPDQRMAALIDRVLEQEWGVRRVRAEVGKLASEASSAAIDQSPGAQSEDEAAAFKVKRTKVVIFTARVAQMNDAQKAELRSVIEPIWNQLGAPMKPAPTPHWGALHWMGNLRELSREWKQVARAGRELWRIFLVYIVGKSPVPADQLPRSVQLPAYGDQHSPNVGAAPHPRQLPERQPVALLPTGKAEESAKPATRNGSEHQLTS